MARAVETVTPIIEARTHTLDVDIPKQPLTIYGDPMRLTQALGNVLGNAAKFTDVGGTHHRTGRSAVGRMSRSRFATRASASSRRCCPVFLISSPSLITRQADRRVGWGIGLALVRQLVEMHSGTVTASSEGLGHGSEFLIRLPIAEPAAEDAPAGVDGHAAGAQKPAAPARPTVQRRILVADDNSDARESLATLLALGGHEVFRAHDGSDALEAAERCRPDVALLDIGMPRADGYEVARQIRGAAVGPRHGFWSR